MTNEFAKNIITEFVFSDYNISSVYKFLNNSNEEIADELTKELYAKTLLTEAMRKAAAALSK